MIGIAWYSYMQLTALWWLSSRHLSLLDCQVCRMTPHFGQILDQINSVDIWHECLLGYIHSLLLTGKVTMRHITFPETRLFNKLSCNFPFECRQLINANDVLCQCNANFQSGKLVRGCFLSAYHMCFLHTRALTNGKWLSTTQQGMEPLQLLCSLQADKLIACMIKDETRQRLKLQCNEEEAERLHRVLHCALCPCPLPHPIV